MSSTAYATEEILVVLVPAGGLESIEARIPIAVIVVILLAIVATSYRQTIHAYPKGEARMSCPGRTSSSTPCTRPTAS